MKTKSTLVLFAAAIIGIGVYLYKQKEEAPRYYWGVEGEEYNIGLYLYASHPVINDLRDGFVDRLNALADANEYFMVTFDEKNASGQSAQLNQLSSYFTRGRHQLVYSIGAPATLSLKAQLPNVKNGVVYNGKVELPALFAGVPDPVRNGFVESLEQPGYGITGARFLPPAKVIFEAFRIALPNAKSIGVLRNPGEINSISTAEPVMDYFQSKGIQVKDFAVTEIAQLHAVLSQMKSSEIDGLFIPTDNLIYQNLQSVLETCAKASIPVFSVTDTAVKSGADFSVGVPYYRVGEITAEIAYEILNERKSANDVPVREIESGYLYVNPRMESIFESWENTAYPVNIVN